MVAALERRDDLSGTRITLQLAGQVDGPSAGGVICLAVLSALDGRDLPADFAMTGTVMPDGTIGSVGGVADKLRAAAKAGAKRALVPSFVRFERDARTGEQVDLRRLAGELKLQLLPVDHIAQAYAAVHRVDPPAPPRPGRDVLDLPEATEELLKTIYKERSAAGAKLWDAIPEQDRATIAADPFTKPLLIDLRMKADGAFRSGKLLYASGTVTAWAAGLAAREQNGAVFAKLPADDFPKAMARADEALAAVLKGVPSGAAMFRASDGRVPEAAAQLCADYCDLHQFQGVNWLVQRRYDAAVAEAAKPEHQIPEKRAELLRGALHFKAAQLWMAGLVKLGTAGVVDDAARVAATLPRRGAPTGGPGKVERLFYSAFLAAHNSFAKDVVAASATELRLSHEEALAAMMERDVSLAMHLSAADAALALHRDLTRSGALPPGGGGEARFASAASAHIYANGLASVSGLITRWSELDVDLGVEGALRYGRTDLLNHLLSTARENALATIAECRKREIPCIQPIASFEEAELGRDDADEDKVGVLSKYWNASLQAKVLLMLNPPLAARR